MEHVKKYKTSIVFTGIFIVILILVISGITQGVDNDVDSLSRNITNSTIHSIFIFITNMGSTKTIVGISLLVMLYAYNKLNNFRVLTLLVTSSLGCYLLNSIIKNLIQRPRPPLPHLVIEHTFSFPSGHAMVSICFYATIVYILTNIVKNHHAIIKVSLYSLSVLVAVSRVILHVHYLTDVVAGFVMGWALFMFLKEAVGEV